MAPLTSQTNSAQITPDSVAARILAQLRTRGDRPFLRIIDGKMREEVFTYRDFFLQAMVTASLFDRHNVPVGGTVIFVLSNPRDVFFAEAGALLTGRIPIVSAHPSPKLSVSDFGRTLLPLIENAEPALIVGDPAYCSYLSASIGRRVASFDDIEVPKTLPQVVNTDNPILFIQYSSGTTGTKKGVTISQAQLLSQVDAYAREIKLADDDHIVSWLPYYHDMGLITCLMMPLLTGTQITVMSPFDWVKSPLMLLNALSRYGGTLCWLPNFAYNFLAQSLQRGDVTGLDLSRVRGVVNCSEPVSATSHDIFLKALAPYGLKAEALAASYAMAETTFAVTSAGFGHSLKVDHIDRAALTTGAAVKPGPHAMVSSGHALSGTDVVILDNSGAALPDQHVGEIAVRSPSRMGGYFKNPEATASAIAGNLLHTGDLGYLSDGELFVTGRIKDLIITAGRNIYPQDIEAIVGDLLFVADGRCVAFGITDDAKGTENVVVLAELKPDSGITARKTAQMIAQAVTNRFDINLADVRIVEAGWLAKSTSGKMARGRNRDRYLELRQQAATARKIDPSDPSDLVRECIFQASGTWVEGADDPLVTAGIIDSLALTNLLLALETTFKKPVPAPEDVGYDCFDSIASIVRLMSSEHAPPSRPAFELVIDRQVKANYVLEGPRDFDTLIAGSSRAYLVRAKHAARFGLKAFQFTVASVRAEELYCMVKLFLQTNRTPVERLIVGLDPIQFSPLLPIDLRLVKSPTLFSLLDAVDQRGEGSLTLEGDGEKNADIAKRAQVRYGAWDIDLAFDPRDGDVIKLFRRDVKSMPALHYTGADLEAKWTQQFLACKDLTHLHPQRLQYFERLVALAADAGCKMSVYTNPLHPLVIARLKEQTPYFETQQALVDHIAKLGAPGLSLHSFATPADFGGNVDDYFDGVHMGRHNGDTLLKYLLTR